MVTKSQCHIGWLPFEIRYVNSSSQLILNDCCLIYGISLLNLLLMCMAHNQEVGGEWNFTNVCIHECFLGCFKGEISLILNMIYTGIGEVCIIATIRLYHYTDNLFVGCTYYNSHCEHKHEKMVYCQLKHSGKRTSTVEY